MRHAFLLASSALLVSSLVAAGPACSSTTPSVTPSDAASSPPPVGGDGGLPDVAIPPLPPPPAGSLVVDFGPIKVAPGVERTQCVTKKLGNTRKIHVGRFQNRLGDASHHLIVYRVNDTVEQPKPVDCRPFADTLDPTKGAPIMISQKAEDELVLPKGVGFAMEANQLVRLEMHYVNASATEKTVYATSAMVPMNEADLKDEADFLFVGNPDIRLPPRSKTTLGPTFLKLPESHTGVNFFALTGHEHSLGTDVKVAVAPDKTGAGTPVYDVPGWLWNEPKTVVHDPPFTVPPGGGFRFSCSYDNVTDKQVGFGESAGNEMCFFWAYYYPAKGPRVCLHTDQVPGGLDACCPGSSVICNMLK